MDKMAKAMLCLAHNQLAGNSILPDTTKPELVLSTNIHPSGTITQVRVQAVLVWLDDEQQCREQTHVVNVNEPEFRIALERLGWTPPKDAK